MSCYMVDNYKIKTLAQAIANDRDNTTLLRRIWEGVMPPVNKIASQLYAMNAQAYHCRYGDYDGAEPDWATVSISTKLLMDRHSINKLLEEFLYQCAEGGVPEMTLYKAAERWYYNRVIDYYHAQTEYERAARRDEAAMKGKTNGCMLSDLLK